MTTLALRRRSRMERRVLAILRGEDVNVLSPEQVLRFNRLRRLAERNGLAIAPSGTPHVNESELRLISWLAEAQRVIPIGAPPPNPCLAAVIQRCAEVLKDKKLRLSPLTLYCSKLRFPG